MSICINCFQKQSSTWKRAEESRWDESEGSQLLWLTLWKVGEYESESVILKSGIWKCAKWESESVKAKVWKGASFSGSLGSQWESERGKKCGLSRKWKFESVKLWKGPASLAHLGESGKVTVEN